MLDHTRQIDAGGTILKPRLTNARVVAAAGLAFALAIGLGNVPDAADAQIIPSTTTTSEPEISTTTTLVETTTTSTTTGTSTTTTTESLETTTSSSSTTAVPGRPTTTVRRTTTSTFVPPSGVTPTSAAPAEEVLDADLGKLPLFVSLSLLGFAVAITIVTVQWVRTRPRRVHAR